MINDREKKDSRDKLILSFMEWVEENCPGDNTEFLNLLKTKLLKLDDNSLTLLINNVRGQVATDPILTTHKNSNQIKWNIYTFILINDLTTELRDGNNNNLMDIITMLGKERHYIAMDLEHALSRFREEFGVIREERSLETGVFCEYIQKQGQLFSYLYDPINREIDKLIADNYLINIGDKYQFHDIPGNVSFLENWDREKNFILANGLPSTSNDMCIIVKMNRDNDSKEILITYPTTEKINIQSRVQALQPLFEQILRINPKNEGDLKNFLMALGELSYHLYRMLPFKRGSAAIVDWLVRAIAESKQIQLGTRKNNDLPQDFKAFLTPNVTQYANWFAENAFNNPVFSHQHETVKIEPVNNFYAWFEKNLFNKLPFSPQQEAVKTSTFGFFCQNAASQFKSKLDSTLPDLIVRDRTLDDIYLDLESEYENNERAKQKYSSYDKTTKEEAMKNFRKEISPVIKAEIDKLKNLPLAELLSLRKITKFSRNPYVDCENFLSQRAQNKPRGK